MSEAEERARVCQIANEWIGTPYHGGGEIKGPKGGVDCAKLLKCVFKEAGLIDDLQIPPYPDTWFLHQPVELFLGWIMGQAREISESETQPGDVALYKMGKCYAHGVIIIEPGWPEIIHAWFAARRVVRARGLDGSLSRPKHIRKYFTRW